jgi:hypothetical protein
MNDYLDKTVAYMLQHKIVRFRSLDGIEIELHPDAFKSTWIDIPLESQETDQAKCDCGHDLVIEHSEVGCLHGCSERLCNAER